MSDVLLVEDEQIYRETLAKALARSGIGVVEADGSRAAIRAALAERPRVLVADWMLRDHYHGVQVARALQTRDPHLQTVLITAFPSDDLKGEVARLGGCELIEKPFSLDELLDVVGRLLRAPEEERAARGAGVFDIGVARVDAEGRVDECNAAAEGLLGRRVAGTFVGDRLVDPDEGLVERAIPRWVEVAPVSQPDRRLALRAGRDLEGGRRLLVVCRAEDRGTRDDLRVRMLLDLSDAPAPSWQYSARIFVLDDDAATRHYSVRQLERAGCACFVADDHDLALKILTVDYGIHFALIDLEAPKPSLSDTVEQIRSARPDLTLIGTSSRPRDPRSGQLGLDRFLRKPWGIEDLARVLDAVSGAPYVSV